MQLQRLAHEDVFNVYPVFIQVLALHILAYVLIERGQYLISSLPFVVLILIQVTPHWTFRHACDL